jgi:mitochondrial chaperone BCS1
VFETWVETGWQFVQNNAFLSGGAVLGAAGILFASLRRVPAEMWAWCKRRVVIEIDLPDRDEAFKWLDLWLTKHKYQKRCRLLTISTSRNRRLDYPVRDAACRSNDDDVRARPEIYLSPAPGTHYFFYRGRFVILRRDRVDGNDTKGGSMTFGYRETFNIKVFTRNRKIIQSMLDEARELAHPEQDERISVFVPSYGDWYRATKRLPRPLESVILADDLADRLLRDMREFLASEDWYNKHGIPYRRGYLLEGPPGNGKSSVVTALAAALKLDICVLNLSAAGASDERLSELMNNVPAGSMLLIEDIDCVFHNREKKDEKDTVTFSGLLNAIDGVMAGEGRILVLTTNHRELLDPALIRPGRCDMQLSVDNATPEQAKQLFLRFFPDKPDLAETFTTTLKAGTSMAAIQGHLLQNRNNAEAALTTAVNML